MKIIEITHFKKNIMKLIITFVAILFSVSCVAQEKTSNETIAMNQTFISLNNGVVIPQFGINLPYIQYETYN